MIYGKSRERLHGNDRAVSGQVLLSKHGQDTRSNPSGSARCVRLAQTPLLTFTQATRDTIPAVSTHQKRYQNRRRSRRAEAVPVVHRSAKGFGNRASTDPSPNLRPRRTSAPISAVFLNPSDSDEHMRATRRSFVVRAFAASGSEWDAIRHLKAERSASAQGRGRPVPGSPAFLTASTWRNRAAVPIAVREATLQQQVAFSEFGKPYALIVVVVAESKRHFVEPKLTVRRTLDRTTSGRCSGSPSQSVRRSPEVTQGHSNYGRVPTAMPVTATIPSQWVVSPLSDQPQSHSMYQSLPSLCAKTSVKTSQRGLSIDSPVSLSKKW